MLEPMIPARILGKLRKICLALPEAYEEPAWVGVRWMVRKKNFAHVVEIAKGHPPAYARAAGTDGPAVIATFRATPELSDVLRTAGPPFFFAEWGTHWGPQVIGMTLTSKTDWKQVAMLLTDSYRELAPMQLAKQLAARK